MRRIGLGLVLALAAIVSACVVGAVYEFDYRPAARSEVGAGATVLLMMPEDLRPDVVAGDEPQAFVGEQRSGGGIPYTVTTAGALPFAEVVAETVRRDLEAAGFHVVRDLRGDAVDLPARMQRSEARRALAMTILEFESDTYVAPTVVWDLVVTVYDEHGALVASDARAGERELPGSFWSAKKSAARRVPPLFYRLVHELVAGNPTVVDALVR